MNMLYNLNCISYLSGRFDVIIPRVKCVSLLSSYTSPSSSSSSSSSIYSSSPFLCVLSFLTKRVPLHFRLLSRDNRPGSFLAGGRNVLREPPGKLILLKRYLILSKLKSSFFLFYYFKSMWLEFSRQCVEMQTAIFDNLSLIAFRCFFFLFLSHCLACPSFLPFFARLFFFFSLNYYDIFTVILFFLMFFSLFSNCFSKFEISNSAYVTVKTRRELELKFQISALLSYNFFYTWKIENPAKKICEDFCFQSWVVDSDEKNNCSNNVSIKFI